MHCTSVSTTTRTCRPTARLAETLKQALDLIEQRRIDLA
jgi:hypothetical protein